MKIICSISFTNFRNKKKEVENGKIGKLHSIMLDLVFLEGIEMISDTIKIGERAFIGCWRICNKTCNKVTWRRYYIESCVMNSYEF